MVNVAQSEKQKGGPNPACGLGEKKQEQLNEDLTNEMKAQKGVFCVCVCVSVSL